MINKALTYFALTLINFYKYLISPFLGNNCRFLPTCSEYTKESIIVLMRQFIPDFNHMETGKNLDQKM